MYCARNLLPFLLTPIFERIGLLAYVYTCIFIHILAKKLGKLLNNNKNDEIKKTGLKQNRVYIC